MMNESIYKSKALDFLKQYDIHSVSSEKLIDILHEQGYEVIYLNRIENHEAVGLLLKELHLEELAKHSKAFTYSKGQNKMVFIDGNLQDADKLRVLAHEEGHIYCGHMERETCSLANIEDEWEANEFAHYILNPPFSISCSVFCRKYKRALITCICVLVLLMAALPIYRTVMEHNSYVKTVDYYVTKTGTKYHTEGCKYLKDADYVRKITEEEFMQGKYEPCSECIE